MATLNLGILAHVDAGKTTLTERLLFAAGAIDSVGSVDEGTTQTDTLALERERGITIRAAVASFAIGDLGVNILDTPGHPDFIAEVERVLNVLDGAVLVVSAVEGVQPQTPLLMRALQRLRVPTLIFVNKIDRPGADDHRTLEGIARRLASAVLPMGRVDRLGSRDATFTPADTRDARFAAAASEVLAERDEAILAAYVQGAAGRPIGHRRLRAALVAQTRRALLHPVFFGSAITGAGVDALLGGVAELLPAAMGDPDGPLAGRVFKIERSASGERIAYLRLFSGRLRVRDRVRHGAEEARVTALTLFTPGGPVQRSSASAGEIAKVSGLTDIRVGDAIGNQPGPEAEHQFSPPTLQSVVIPRRPADRGRLRLALTQLAEQDPLINVRLEDASGEISVSLYGEVQKEVIGETLARDFGVEVDFRETTTIFVERPVGTGEALEVLRAATHSNVTGKSSPYSDNPFLATLGLRVEPAASGSGIQLRLEVDVRLLPLYVYRTVETFMEHMRQYVREALEEGLAGWRVTDCTVTVVDCGYRAPGTTAADFHKLTHLVMMEALDRAGTTVCEPMVSVRLELPTDALGRVLPLLSRIGADVEAPLSGADLSSLEGVLAAADLDTLRRALPGISGGEGVLEARFAGYRPMSGPAPTRRRTRPNPLNRDEYLMHLSRRVGP
ncbi:MAG TPA: translation factor GTPase family protein [Candidatus Limnocylindria bacterium]|nr:translation factor GTPase family protein [Candidatus Limnocylindria bacterium]